MDNQIEEKEIEFVEVFHPSFTKKKIKLTIARLDKIHPVISGNKLFKLHYFLKEAIFSAHKNIVTFGGAYSNHLIATAYAANKLGLNSTALVRGERPAKESTTLQMCRKYGMHLEFISRMEYKNINEHYYQEKIQIVYGDCIIIPEGGFHPLGAKGASLIMEKLNISDPSHICVPVGTATTLAGLLSVANKNQKIMGFPVLINMTDIGSRISRLIGSYQTDKLILLDKYHFGGYAKSTNELISFMNTFYKDHKVPLDFVYTAKMMYGTIEKIDQQYFPEGSNIMCLHTGGLQGNISLQKGKLVY